MNAFYFGCWSPTKIGHYLYDRDGRSVERSCDKTLPIKATALDGSLLNGVPDSEGNAVLFQGRGYTFLSFWDRSGDSRGASNSTFVLPGTLPFVAAVEAARALFPERWTRIKFAITEYPS